MLLDQVEDAGGVGEVAARDAQAVLRLQHLEIGVGHRGYGGQGDDLAGVAARLRRFHGGLQRRLVLAPEVDDVARAQRGQIVAGERRHPATAAPDTAGAGAELLRGLAGGVAPIEIDQRQQCRAGDPHLRIGLQDLGDRNRDVEVCRLGFFDQRRKLAGPEAAPPIERGHGGLGRAFGVFIALGHIDGDVGLVGVEQAARQARDQRETAGGANDATQPAGYAADIGILPVRTHLPPTTYTTRDHHLPVRLPNSTAPLRQ